MKISLKLLATFLAVLMFFYVIPLAALAEEYNSEEEYINSDFQSSNEAATIKYEEINKRTANTKTYMMSDGLHQLHLYAYDIHYLNEENNWVEYNKEILTSKKVNEFSKSDKIDISLSDSLKENKPVLKNNVKTNIKLSSLPVFDDEIIVSDARFYFELSETDSSKATVSVYKPQSLIQREEAALSAEEITKTFEVAQKVSEIYSIADIKGRSGVININDIVNEWYKFGNCGLALALENTTSSLLVPQSGVVMTMSYSTTDEYKQAGSWDSVATIGNVSIMVNTFNGGLRLVQGDISTGGTFPINIIYSYDTNNADVQINNALGKGWKWNYDDVEIRINSNVSYATYVDSDGKKNDYYCDYVDISGYPSYVYTCVDPNNQSNDPNNPLIDHDNPSRITNYTNNILCYTDGFGLARMFDKEKSNRLSQETYINNTLDYSYVSNKLDNISLNSSPLIKFTYTGNALTRIKNNVTGEYVDYLYSSSYNNDISESASGYLRRVNYSNGMSHSFDYNSSGQIIKITDNQKTSTYIDLTYTNNANNNSLISVSTLKHYEKATLTKSYSYNYQNYLTKVTDVLGNRAVSNAFNSNGDVKYSYSYNLNANDERIDALSTVNYNSDKMPTAVAAGNFNPEYNPLKNNSFQSTTTDWNTSNGGSYVTASGRKVMKVTGSSSAYRFAYQTMTAAELSAKGITKDSNLLLSGYVYQNGSLAVPSEPPYTTTSFGFSIIVRYTNGSYIDIRVNANSNLTGWQYISLLIIPPKTSAITSATVYCSYDNNTGYAYFDDVTLTAVNATEYTYTRNQLVSSAKNEYGTSSTTYTDHKPYIQTDNYGTRYTTTYENNKVSTFGEYASGTLDNLTTNTYGEEGELLSTLVGVKNSDTRIKTTYSYTSDLQRLAGITDSRNNTTNYVYNTDKTLKYMQSPTIQTSNYSRTAYTYDSNKRISRIFLDRNANGLFNSTAEESVAYSYTSGLLTGIGTNSTNYILDYTGDKLKSVQISGQSSKLVDYTYDARQRLTKTTYGNGFYKSPTYNTLDQITQILYNGSVKAAFTFNNDGSLATTTDYNVNNSTMGGLKAIVSYDKFGRLASETHSTVTGSTQKLNVAYTYDSKGLPATVTETFGGAAKSYTYTYNANTDIVNNINLGNSRYIAYTYDKLGRMTGKYARSAATGGTVKASEVYTYLEGSSIAGSTTTSLIETVTTRTDTVFGYTYDAQNNISTIKEGSTTKASYKYDALGQLIRENNAVDNKTYVYAYDNAGNITSKKTYAYTTGTLGTIQSTKNYSYSGDRMTSYDGTSITYDNAGNPLKWRGGASLTWEGKNLTSLNYGGSLNGLSFKYNSSGLRTQKVNAIDRIESYYYYDTSGRLVYEDRIGYHFNDRIYFIYDATGIAGFTYTRGSYEQTYYYSKNAQGDVVEIYDNGGTIYAGYRYDAWGNCTIIFDHTSATYNIATINPIRYRSYYYDVQSDLY
ncbi:DUF6531 domain-containing protein, partial [Eubacteriales bacterium OttesenSCG-928-G02]|nr:DUF6531 domain-containing protein [Eubacteriales bacterium OttesenSCG-928-G02]